MKLIRLSILLFILGFGRVFASDSLSYEELPECFFELDSIYVLQEQMLTDFQIRKIGIDTCQSSELIDEIYWPVPVNANSSIIQMEGYREELANNSKIYSNQIIGIYSEKSENGIFDTSFPSDIEIRELEYSDLNKNMADVVESFESLKSNIGEFKIYAHGYKKTSENEYSPVTYALVFDKFVSVKYVLETLGKAKIESKDFWYVSGPISVEEEFEFEVEISSNSVRISNAQEALHIQIYDLSGNIIKSFGKITDKEYTIDMDEFNQGVYFVKINNQIVKYIGLR